jgi:hypothetical protein
MWSNVEQCGAMWSNVEQCGAMWSDVERCGTHNRDMEGCGAMWEEWYNAYYILLAIRYRTIEFDQKFGNNANAPRHGLQVVHSLATSRRLVFILAGAVCNI